MLKRNYFSENDVRYAQSCFLDNKKLDYQKMDIFVDKVIRSINPKGHSLKYRASNNTNRSDAAHFHRDICNHNIKSIPKLYTVLVYLDNATMEYMPDSHKKPAMNIFEAVTSKSRILHLQPGDLLIFNSATLHRGGFSPNSSENRRLLQIFDVTFGQKYTKQILQMYKTKFTKNSKR